jgi:hypothetical protein
LDFLTSGSARQIEPSPYSDLNETEHGAVLAVKRGGDRKLDE